MGKPGPVIRCRVCRRSMQGIPALSCILCLRDRVPSNEELLCSAECLGFHLTAHGQQATLSRQEFAARYPDFMRAR